MSDLVQQLREFPQFVSMDPGRWFQSGRKEPICQRAADELERLTRELEEARKSLQSWVPAHERVPNVGTECVVLVSYSQDRPPFATVDKWDVQREDPTGMGGPTIETGECWNDNFESDVIAWIAIPPYPPAEWDQRFDAAMSQEK